MAEKVVLNNIYDTYNMTPLSHQSIVELPDP